MREFTIFKRLGLGYLVILLLVIALGVYSTLKLGQLKQITRSISSIDSETIRMANRLRDAFFSQGGLKKNISFPEIKTFTANFWRLRNILKRIWRR